MCLSLELWCKNKDKGIVVWTLFNKHTRKSQRRPNKKLKKKIKQVNIEIHITELLAGYKSPGFVNKLRIYIMSLPTNVMARLTAVADDLLINQTLPRHIPLIVKDLAKFRLNRHCINVQDKQPDRGFLKLQFSNKGIEMINLSQILNSKPVINAIPSFLSYKEPPIVSYSCTKQ